MTCQHSHLLGHRRWQATAQNDPRSIFKLLTSIEVPVFHIWCGRVTSQDPHDALGGLLNSIHGETKVFPTVSLQHTREIVVKPLLVRVDGH